MFIQGLLIQMSYASYALKTNTQGIDQEESLKSPEGGGNGLNWTLGHLLEHRNEMLIAMGKEPVRQGSELDPYRRKSEVPLTSENALSLESLLEDLDKARREIVAGLPSLTEEDLSKKAHMSPGGSDEETVGSLLAGLFFHDAYHVGQTGLLRRTLGKDGALA